MYDILEKIGLSKSEAKVYSALIEIGSSTLSKIQKRSGLERRYIYDVLNKLIDKGLVSYNLEKGKKNFQASNPRRLVGYVQEKKDDLEKIESSVVMALPEIMKEYEKNRSKINVEIFRGKDGVKAIGEDMLNYRDNYFIGGNGSVENYVPYYWVHFNKKRIKNKVMWHDLIIEGSLMDEFKDLGKARTKLRELKFYKYKILPSELASPHVISIYGNKVVFTLWSDYPFNLVVESEEIARSYLKHFKFLWKIAKK